MLALLRRGVERGEVRPGAATALVADVLPAVLAHRVIMQRERITERTITEIMDQVLIRYPARRGAGVHPSRLGPARPARWPACVTEPVGRDAASPTGYPGPRLPT